MSLLFVSDVHLSPERPAVSRAFFDFLENRASQAQQLYILGDLVEAWIGDDDPEDLSRQLVDRLQVLSDRGVELYFQHGNRDFLVGRTFARDTGATLLPDYHLIPWQGHRLLLCHGDTLCLDDADYQRFRRRIRRPFVQWLLRHLPLTWRQGIARRMRDKSRRANANKPENIMDVTPAEVERVMRQWRADTLIHGHTHRPGRYPEDTGERIVLGDWHHRGWYLEARNGELHLSDFPIVSPT